jgi:hypothetical protein
MGICFDSSALSAGKNFFNWVYENIIYTYLPFIGYMELSYHLKKMVILCRGLEVSLPPPERHVYQRDHHRHLDERPYHRSERLPRADAEHAERNSDCLSFPAEPVSPVEGYL